MTWALYVVACVQMATGPLCEEHIAGIYSRWPSVFACLRAAQLVPAPIPQLRDTIKLECRQK